MAWARVAMANKGLRDLLMILTHLLCISCFTASLLEVAEDRDGLANHPGW